MIPYQFLDPAEEEMNEAAAYYEAASDALGFDFLADVQFGIDRLCEHPYVGLAIGDGLRTEYRRQNTGVRIQNSGVRRRTQKSEARSQRSEVRSNPRSSEF